MSDEKKPPVTVSEAGRLGGKKGGATTKARYGHEFYVAIGRKGGRKVRERGHEFYEEIGRKGGGIVRTAGILAEAVVAFADNDTPETRDAFTEALAAYRKAKA